jgi:hypothetical protein
MATPFDWRKGRVTGPAVPVLEGAFASNVARADVLPNGSVVMPWPPARAPDGAGESPGHRDDPATEARAFSDPRFSLNGRQIAVTSLCRAGLAGDI